MKKKKVLLVANVILLFFLKLYSTGNTFCFLFFFAKKAKQKKWFSFLPLFFLVSFYFREQSRLKKKTEEEIYEFRILFFCSLLKLERDIVQKRLTGDELFNLETNVEIQSEVKDNNQILNSVCINSSKKIFLSFSENMQQCKRLMK